MTTTKRTLVLASTSPFRKALLARLGIAFETFAPDVDEARRNGESPDALVRRLAQAKAQAAGDAWPDALIIGSDQVAVCGEDVLGKPGNHANARAQLARLSGHTVSFYSGLCLYDSRSAATQVDLVPYHVTFRPLDAEQIERYLNHDRPYNCAGSFKSEGLGISLFAAMRGEDPNALIGLPLIRLVTWLNQAGVAVP
jgi:MAF protein